MRFSTDASFLLNYNTCEPGGFLTLLVAANVHRAHYINAFRCRGFSLTVLSTLFHLRVPTMAARSLFNAMYFHCRYTIDHSVTRQIKWSILKCNLEKKQGRNNSQQFRRRSATDVISARLHLRFFVDNIPKKKRDWCDRASFVSVWDGCVPPYLVTSGWVL